MTPEQRQTKMLKLQIDEARRQANLLKRSTLANQYLREDLQRQIVGAAESFIRTIDKIDTDKIGLEGILPKGKRYAGV